ncbi:phosphatidylinositol N-acetylglucosaminyltransferase subunit H [Spathaspora passalidarum NRRL Y-27907]|uniref:Phosphatidylinositol N-acetylglucosaminyltransferase subunit H n=1 Tax=Spathaspora passalidarum (strain NRRL Y-27907 / 11-Y1) TaxID=619300 RepID=G3AIR3_SPAPN|nr:phosphatidylinositol N-acetylglucosaminyltransferase subunit H [Spathaspora passalidarum NRRL Y-27907]EGW34479.1 phosphatidylinositol N-acetylglucosaminyltransferase subunit H [Spathaspora passalidarum NRRL Y-27907]
MSSPKDFSLEVTPPIDTANVESLNLLKFTVKDKKNDIILKNRPVILFILTGTLIAYISNIIFNVNLEHVDISHLSKVQYGFILALVTMIALVSLRQQPEDTMIVMKGIGVQLVTKKKWRFQNSSQSFIPIKDMIDLVIHEGFHKYGQVIFYLCVLTRSNDQSGNDDSNIIKVIFPEFLPRRDILLKVWKLSRELLFGSPNRYWRRVPGQGLKQVLS